MGLALIAYFMLIRYEAFIPGNTIILLYSQFVKYDVIFVNVDHVIVFE